MILACEDILSLTESFRDSLVDWPELTVFFQSPDCVHHVDGHHGDHILFAGYWTPDRHQLSLATSEAEQF